MSGHHADELLHDATLELSSELRIAVARLSRRLRAEKADDELSEGQMMVLAAIKQDGPLTLSALSERERVTLPSMNRRVNTLVEAGYIEREQSTDDRRKVLLHLTSAGVELVLEIRRRRTQWLYQRLTLLDPTERENLAQAASVLRELADS